MVHDGTSGCFEGEQSWSNDFSQQQTGGKIEAVSNYSNLIGGYYFLEVNRALTLVTWVSREGYAVGGLQGRQSVPGNKRHQHYPQGEQWGQGANADYHHLTRGVPRAKGMPTCPRPQAGPALPHLGQRPPAEQTAGQEQSSGLAARAAILGAPVGDEEGECDGLVSSDVHMLKCIVYICYMIPNLSSTLTVKVSFQMLKYHKSFKNRW